MPPSNTVNLLNLDDAPSYRNPDVSGDWIPVRHLLDVRAFGVNAWVARQAGDIAVEDHDERDDAGPGQEELYVVLRGAARFTVGDETFDARAGFLVHIPDPSLRRSAVALEDDTLTLTLGHTKGNFTPSEWEGRWLREFGHADG